MHPTRWLDTVLQDLRYGARELRRNPGFAITAIVSLALGIMAATAMYSVIYGVVLEPFPYRDVNNLVSIVLRAPEQRGYGGSYTPGDYAELSRRATVFEGIAGSTISDVLWTSGSEPRRLRGNHISNNGFDVMGVGGREWHVIPTPGALIRLNGKAARLDALQAGDTVVILGQAQAGPGNPFLEHAITARRK